MEFNLIRDKLWSLEHKIAHLSRDLIAVSAISESPFDPSDLLAKITLNSNLIEDTITKVNSNEAKITDNILAITDNSNNIRLNEQDIIDNGASISANTTLINKLNRTIDDLTNTVTNLESKIKSELYNLDQILNNVEHIQSDLFTISRLQTIFQNAIEDYFKYKILLGYYLETTFLPNTESEIGQVKGPSSYQILYSLPNAEDGTIDVKFSRIESPLEIWSTYGSDRKSYGHNYYFTYDDDGNVKLNHVFNDIPSNMNTPAISFTKNGDDLTIRVSITDVTHKIDSLDEVISVTVYVTNDSSIECLIQLSKWNLETQKLEINKLEVINLTQTVLPCGRDILYFKNDISNRQELTPTDAGLVVMRRYPHPWVEDEPITLTPLYGTISFNKYTAEMSATIRMYHTLEILKQDIIDTWNEMPSEGTSVTSLFLNTYTVVYALVGYVFSLSNRVVTIEKVDVPETKIENKVQSQDFILNFSKIDVNKLEWKTDPNYIEFNDTKLTRTRLPQITVTKTLPPIGWSYSFRIGEPSDENFAPTAELDMPSQVNPANYCNSGSRVVQRSGSSILQNFPTMPYRIDELDTDNTLDWYDLDRWNWNGESDKDNPSQTWPGSMRFAKTPIYIRIVYRVILPIDSEATVTENCTFKYVVPTIIFEKESDKNYNPTYEERTVEIPHEAWNISRDSSESSVTFSTEILLDQVNTIGFTWMTFNVLKLPIDSEYNGNISTVSSEIAIIEQSHNEHEEVYKPNTTAWHPGEQYSYYTNFNVKKPPSISASGEVWWNNADDANRQQQGWLYTFYKRPKIVTPNKVGKENGHGIFNVIETFHDYRKSEKGRQYFTINNNLQVNEIYELGRPNTLFIISDEGITLMEPLDDHGNTELPKTYFKIDKFSYNVPKPPHEGPVMNETFDYSDMELWNAINDLYAKNMRITERLSKLEYRVTAIEDIITEMMKTDPPSLIGGIFSMLFAAAAVAFPIVEGFSILKGAGKSIIKQSKKRRYANSHGSKVSKMKYRQKHGEVVPPVKYDITEDIDSVSIDGRGSVADDSVSQISVAASLSDIPMTGQTVGQIDRITPEAAIGETITDGHLFDNTVTIRSEDIKIAGTFGRNISDSYENAISAGGPRGRFAEMLRRRNVKPQHQGIDFEQNYKPKSTTPHDVDSYAISGRIGVGEGIGNTRHNFLLGPIKINNTPAGPGCIMFPHTKKIVDTPNGKVLRRSRIEIDDTKLERDALEKMSGLSKDQLSKMNTDELWKSNYNKYIVNKQTRSKQTSGITLHPNTMGKMVDEVHTGGLSTGFNYSLLNRNCQDFSSEMASLLLGESREYKVLPGSTVHSLMEDAPKFADMTTDDIKKLQTKFYNFVMDADVWSNQSWIIN